MVLLINLLAMAAVAAPLIASESLRSRSKWLEQNHGWLSFFAWLVGLLVLYLIVVPKLGLELNPDFFRND